MPNCIKCGAYTKYNGGTCTDCYHVKKGLQFSENMIKGRIAETLIEELFLTFEYEVFRYGMENTIPGIMNMLSGVKSDEATHIRRMPDFVVLSPDAKKVHFVEVKFKANGCFNYANLKDDYPEGYDNAFIIVVSKKHIKCLTAKELKNGKEITAECKNYLGSRKEFDLDNEMIVTFCKFATKFFEMV